MRKRKIVYTTKFKKDLKRYRNDLKRRSKIVDVIEMLSKGVEIPIEMRPHKLIGNYEGCMELPLRVTASVLERTCFQVNRRLQRS